MNNYLAMTLAIGAFTGTIMAQDKTDLKDPVKRVSYCIGVNIGSDMKRQGIEIDPKAMAAGLTEAFAGKPSLTEDEIRETLTKFSNEMREKMTAKQKVDGDKNTKLGETFLAENAKKEGVKVLASGLQYKVIKSGTGKTPKLTDQVKTHYHGTLIDGSVFDSSVQRGEPAQFGVNQVIAGWTEALQLMKEGDKWQLYIPAKLAYGERAPSPKIGANSTLIFDIELISVEGGK